MSKRKEVLIEGEIRGYLEEIVEHDEHYRYDKKKRANYSGPFILRHHKNTLSAQQVRRVQRIARMFIAEIAHPSSAGPT